MAKNQFPYIEFGQFLERARKSKGFTQKVMAQKLGMSLEEYVEIEAGIKLSEMRIQVGISDVLGIDLQEVIDWTVSCQTGIAATENQTKFVSSYEGKLDDVFESIKLMKLSEVELKGLAQLKTDLSEFSSFYFLPEETALLLQILLRQEGKHKYLREYKGLFAEGENLVGFIARQPQRACSTLSAANALFYYDKPFDSIEECCDSLTRQQFEVILFLGQLAKGIYGCKKYLPYLQMQSEFASTAALMTRQLKPHVQKYLNYDHLYSSVLMQNIGELVLMSVLYDDTVDSPEEMNLKPEYACFSKGLLEQLQYEGHPVFGSLVLERFGFAKEVCDAVLKHHERSMDDDNPLKDVDPLVQTMKLIARYTDNHFIYISPEDTKEVLKVYPGVPISADEFCKVCLSMYEMRNSLVEVSSTILEQSNPESLVSGRKAIDSLAKAFEDEKDSKFADIARKEDVRLVPEYQIAFKEKAEELFSVLQKRMLVESISHEFKISKEDIYKKMNIFKSSAIEKIKTTK